MQLVINNLVLTNFRNHQKLELVLGGDPVIITGNNGAGKTNILEAVSLLAPGRGFRGAKLDELCRKDKEGASHAWHLDAVISGAYGMMKLITSFGGEERVSKRNIKLNDQPVKNHAELAKVMAIIWLIPQMDHLFIAGNAVRRRFLDRLVINFYPDHADYLIAYEVAMRERLRLLTTGRKNDLAWISALEQQMSEKGAAIAAARVSTIAYLQSEVYNINYNFPKAKLDIKGSLEQQMNNMPALQLEQWFCEQLTQNRNLDSHTGRTNVGIHRSDLVVYHVEKNTEAGLCSTGEQKALLISIILAKARAKMKQHDAVPVLLLDEVVAHLDKRRREALFAEIQELQAQAWITGTTSETFNSLRNQAQFFEIT